MSRPAPKAEGAIRIVTWNAHAGFHKKLRRLTEELAPDVAVVSEACTEGRLRKAGVANFSSMQWIGRIPNRGVAAIGFGSCKVKMKSKQWDQRLEWVLPVGVDGPVPFNLFACWIKNAKARCDVPMDADLTQGAKLPLVYETLVSDPDVPVVIAGDFNNSVNWDKGTERDFCRLVEQYDSLGLVSAYHHWAAEAFGNESSPTFWAQYDSQKPYHIDYCFVPKNWAITQVWVGNYTDWIRKKDGSDHAPLVVDVVPG